MLKNLIVLVFITTTSRNVIVHGESTSIPNHYFNVLDFGAKADRTTDNTEAFSKAILNASSISGGVVYAPPGFYVFNGHLNIPSGVTLKGSYHSVPSHDLRNGPPQHDGTFLVPREGRGDASKEPFLHVGANAAVASLVIYYDQQETVQLPVPYPWTILMDGNNAAVTDVELLGSWRGINATGAGRHYIARVQGQPIDLGVFVDQTYDIGRMENIHFNPWFSSSQPFMSYQLTYGRAFVLGRSDWEYVFNTFSFGYSIGYHFIETSTGSMNGNFLGLGADLAVNASVRVDASQQAGLLITNGEFTAFHDKTWLPIDTSVESSQVVVTKDNAGPVKFVDSSFWGPTSQIALIDGTGTVTFDSCEFVEWDEQAGDGRAALRVLGSGSLILNGNHFNQNKKQVELGANAKRLVMIGNIFEGPQNISVASNTTQLHVGYNAGA